MDKKYISYITENTKLDPIWFHNHSLHHKCFTSNREINESNSFEILEERGNTLQMDNHTKIISQSRIILLDFDKDFLIWALQKKNQKYKTRVGNWML
jgi:hypothetical protein